MPTVDGQAGLQLRGGAVADEIHGQTEDDSGLAVKPRMREASSDIDARFLAKWS